MFTDIMGKSLPQFYSNTDHNLTIPTVNDSTMTTFKISFIVGKYGSQKVKYIDRITYSYESNGANVRSLYINFIDADNIKAQ